MPDTDESDASPSDESQVLRALKRRVVLAFDFDETLAPRTTDALVEHLGLDVEQFRDSVDGLVDQGWVHIRAQEHRLLEVSRDRTPITADTFIEVADRLELYPGVAEMFGRVRAAVAEVADDIDVEFHLLTAGTIHVPSATSIADEFTSIIGGEWAFDDEGTIERLKVTVGHYDKVRHLMALAKGLDTIEATTDRDIDRHVPEDEWHCPYEQMVFVGDGDSDLPAFDFMQSKPGTAIAVFQADDEAEWESRADMREGRQVAALVTSDFSEGAPAMRALEAAARRAAWWVELVATSHPDR